MAIDLAPMRPTGLRLRHPVIVAAGGAGYGGELVESVGDLTPGALVTRGVSRRGRRGGAAPHMTITAGALLSSFSRQDPGLDAVVRRHGPRWAATDVPVIVSIWADSAEDIAWLARRLDLLPDVAGVELDLAAPDRGRGGLPIGLDVEASELATVGARTATDLPLIVKLSPVAPNVREMAQAVAAAGADAISAIGPLPALAIDAGRKRALLGATYGGLSGPAVTPMALRVIFEIAQVVRIPIVGIGGVHSLDDVLDFLAAGATAVGLSTAALADPTLPGRLGQELEAWCAGEGVSDVRQLIGTALPRRRDRGSLRSV
jgi:dihydroorotate dehydrogenase (NAD+) catalytic subunit